MKIKASIICAMLLACIATTALADGMNEYYVAGTVNDMTWEGFFATSSMSMDDAKMMAVAACGNTPFCNENAVYVERGCIAYAESADSWAIHGESTLDMAVSKALQACAQESQSRLQCNITGVWCSDR